ncbi:MAG: response regulator [Clostridiales bacterium]|nr:response regulator [Clostridiales bacterium]
MTMRNPNDQNDKKEMFQSSHLMMLITYSICVAVLIGEAILLGWEKWVLPLLTVAVIICWVLHFRQDVTAAVRIRIYAILMMCTAFYYGIHATSVFDFGIVMAMLIVLFTTSSMKSLITMCQITYYLTMGYNFSIMVMQGETFDRLMLTRSGLHLILIFVIGWFSKTIIDKWTQTKVETQEEIAQLTEDTERLNDFLANVSHEIRTPVNAVIGLTSICIDKSVNREIYGDLISVRDAGRKVAEQISDILDYSELDRGKAVANNEDYMLSSVFHDLVTEIRQSKSKDVELIIDVDPAIPAVMNTDVSKLKKILRALISNGLKYTKQGGVYVRIVCEEQSYGVNLCIEVTDTGIGMSEYELEKVYDSFYQADSGRARMGGGLGLGLAIVSGFVSLLGGFMTIRSKKDVGTTVNVSLPQKVVDPTSCMSVMHPDQLCLGAYLHFEKYGNPVVREYYNSMVLNIVKGLGIQMHRVNNPDDLHLLHDSIHMTHLFVAEEEYGSNVEFIEELAKDVLVVVVANDDFKLPQGSHARVMEKPFYCFPVVSVLNTNVHESEVSDKKMVCRGVRALVVDDEPMNLVVGKSIFRSYGMEVTTVLSGQESIDICKEHEFDIIFMDHMMSGMDGVEAMKRIRSDVAGKNSETPIVALTANAMSSAKQMFLAEGFDGFVSKPIETDELERVMRQVLPKSLVTYEEIAPGGEQKTNFEELRKTPTPAVSRLSLKEQLKPYGVDAESGIKYCMGDTDFYKSLLVQFAMETEEKIPLMGRYYESSDWHNYEILVHALKSTSKMIGASALSESARQLEMAAKEKRDDFIAEHHYGLMGDYSHLSKGIAEILKDEIEKARAEKEAEKASQNESSEEYAEPVSEEKGKSGSEEKGKYDSEDQGKVLLENKDSEASGDTEEILEFLPEDEEGGDDK